MAKIVTRLAPKRGAAKCKSQAIGRDIEFLSNRLSSLNPRTINTSSDLSKSWDQISDNAAMQRLKRILEGLSIDVIDDPDNPEVKGPDLDPSDLQNYVNVKFLFEQEGELVIVIPHESAIDFGLEDPPLNFDSTYNEFVRHQVMMGDARGELRSELLNSGMSEQEADGILEFYDHVAGEPPVGGPDATFYTQLGEYSCRQCGH